MSSRREVLAEAVRYLEFELEAGRTTVEMEPARLQVKRRPAAAIPSTRPPEAATSAAVPPRPKQDAPADGGKAASGLSAIAAEVDGCTRCPLHKGRNRTVPGQGCCSPEILFVGEGPGADEDRQGLAFVGRAGQLLTKMIEAMGYTRDEVFIANIVKCRPPDNRQPLPDEMESCIPYLKRQIAILRPKVIVALGATALRGLMNISSGITKLRGTWMTYEGIDLMPTYHPAYLLRNPPSKHDAWEDLKSVLKRLGRTPPPVKPARPD